jgi:hypothetical protein
VPVDPERVKVGSDTGQFLGPLTGRDQLAPAATYYFRAMQASDGGQQSLWSDWHQAIKTENSVEK